MPDAPQHGEGDHGHATDDQSAKILRKQIAGILGIALLVAVGLLVAEIIYALTKGYPMDKFSWLGLALQMMCVFTIASGYFFIQKADSPKDKHLDWFGFVGIVLILLGGTGLISLFFTQQQAWIQAASLFQDVQFADEPNVDRDPNDPHTRIISTPDKSKAKRFFVVVESGADEEKTSIKLDPTWHGQIYYKDKDGRLSKTKGF